MSTLLLMLLFLGMTEQSVQLQGPFVKPVLHWEDLNHDGVLDLWIKDVTGKIWVRDGNKATEDAFEELSFDRLNGKEKPMWYQDQWLVSTYFEDSYLSFKPTEGWQILLNYGDQLPVRQGIQPIDAGQQKLIPTIDGYRLADGPCIGQRFKILPAINLRQKRLTVTYPIPSWRDLNNDGIQDLLGPPVSFQQQGLLGIWTAQKQGTTWVSHQSKLQVDPGLEIQQFQLGDVNDDGFKDLVIIARPSKDLSVFEELSFMIYLGEDHGKWNPVPLQTLKTKQNLWQTGPMEVSKQGIFIYYYKGLIRSKFKIDRYTWDDAGFINPKPISTKWKVKDADRDFIVIDYDFNNDGMKDLLLEGEDGLQVHYRQKVNAKNLPFTESYQRFESQKYRIGNTFMSINLGGDSDFTSSETIQYRLKKERRAALIPHGESYRFWHFKIDEKGAMDLSYTHAGIN